MNQLSSTINSNALQSIGLNKDLLAQTAFQTQRLDNLSVVVSNIKIYCSLLIQNTLEDFELSKFKYLLQSQLSGVWLKEPLKDFKILIDQPVFDIQGYELYQNLTRFQQMCRQLSKLQTEPTSDQQQAHTVIQGFFRQLEQIIHVPERTIQRLNAFDVYAGEQTSSQPQQPSLHQPTIIIPPQSHYAQQLLNTKIQFSPDVFSWVRPSLHQVYISEASRAYKQIAPIRIKTISPHAAESPNINIKNYFTEGIQESKAIMAYCIPGTKNIGFYSMVDICKLSSMLQQYYQEKTLTNDWVFSDKTRSIITPDGKIFSINTRTTPEKIDKCLYQINQTKASNRGPLPYPKRESSFIYLNKYLYVIGGFGQGEKVSLKNFRYNIKQKKWSPIADSNIALKKPTICTLNNRYLLKIGGLNEFDYISKIIEIYDPLTDKWSLVRATPKNIMEEVEMLQDSLAVQINDDQVYVFGGKNSNKYSSDKGFILQINQIKERRKGAAKVNGQIWNVSVGKRNMLTFFGSYSPSNVIVHFNSIYLLRVKYGQALSI